MPRLGATYWASKLTLGFVFAAFGSEGLGAHLDQLACLSLILIYGFLHELGLNVLQISRILAV